MPLPPPASAWLSAAVPDARAEPLPGTAAVILCGGRSRRMGVSKALLPMPGGTLLQLALEHTRQVARPVVLSLAAGQPVPPLPAQVLWVRDVEEFPGPLWGLEQAFERLAAATPAPRTVLVLPVDMPFYTPRWMALLAAELGQARACLFRWQGISNALAAAYRLDLLPKLRQLVQAGQRRPIALSEGEPTRIVDLESHWQAGQGPPPLLDTDTPEDYREALLWSGCGERDGVPVTVRPLPAWPVPDWPAGRGSGAAGEQAGADAERASAAREHASAAGEWPLPLQARTALQLARALQRLFPAALPDAAQALRAGRLTRGPDGLPLAKQDVLRAGEELVLHLSRPPARHT